MQHDVHVQRTGIMNSLRSLLVAITALTLTGEVQADSRRDLANAAHAFEQSALRLQDSDDKPRGVVRWTQPIKYVATNSAGSPNIERSAFATVQRLGALAGIAVAEVQPGDPQANVYSILTSGEAPATPGQAGAQTCYSRTSWKDSRITKVELYINFANIMHMDRCVVHEAFHGFGFNSHPHSADSILSYVYNRRDLTDLDLKLISTLYDPRLTPGMPRAKAARVACEVLGEKMSMLADDIEAVCSLRK